MKSCNSKIIVNSSAFLALIIFCASAQAVTIDWVTVGNPGNANDPYEAFAATDNPGFLSFGGVATTYRISSKEVTNSQYVEFMNAVDLNGGDSAALGLYDPKMTFDAAGNVGGINYASGNAAGSRYSVKSVARGNDPVVYVNYWDALRFSNWLNNGQGAGSTESGAYTLDGNVIPSSTGLRNPGATVFLPNENEWYKAAYYNGSTYFNFATQSNSQPTSGPPTAAANFANFYDLNGNDYAVTGSGFYDVNQNYLTNAGAYTGSASFYGTFDQNGNVWEWFESEGLTFNNPAFRGIRGSGWDDFDADTLSAHFRNSLNPNDNDIQVGFRVASLFFEPPTPGNGGVPEPSTLLLSAVGLFGLMRKRRQK